MIRRTRVFRVNGDNLSAWFSPEGSLSSAILVVEGTRYTVTRQLPGLTAQVVKPYLSGLGYTLSHHPDCIRVGRNLNQKLQGSEIFVETVTSHYPLIWAGAVLVADRSRACCRRLFVVVYNQEMSAIRFEAVRCKVHVEAFLARIR